MVANRKAPAPTPTEEGAPTFEAALERLESIVEDLEAGSLSLEESIARYEEGVRLSRRLTQTLDEAEKRIERLVEEDGQQPTTRPDGEEAAKAERANPGGGEGELPF